MLVSLLLVSLPLLLPFLVHAFGVLLPLAATLASEPDYTGDPRWGYVATDVPAASVAIRSAPCRVSTVRPERRAYPRPVLPTVRAVYSPAPAPSLSIPSVL